MNEMLQRYLDGELRLEELPPNLHGEARRWSGRIEASRRSTPAGMPAGLEERIMTAVRGAQSPSTARGLWGWLIRPRQVSVSPLAALAGATAVVALLVVGRGPPTAPGNAGDLAPMELDVIVEFALEAPGARSVAVAGDFTTWTPRVQLQDPDGDGVWSGRVRVSPGIHKYMFVVDGSRWVTDPRASRHVDDGFGNRNAVLVVPGGAES